MRYAQVPTARAKDASMSRSATLSMRRCIMETCWQAMLTVPSRICTHPTAHAVVTTVIAPTAHTLVNNAACTQQRRH